MISCGSNVEDEIVKSVILKALLQIDRSQNITDRGILIDCSYYLGIEAKVKSSLATKIQKAIDKIRLL